MVAWINSSGLTSNVSIVCKVDFGIRKELVLAEARFQSRVEAGVLLNKATQRCACDDISVPYLLKKLR
jgi:hypothetical protein